MYVVSLTYIIITIVNLPCKVINLLIIILDYSKGITSTSCNFEGPSTCSFSQETVVDDFDWSLGQGSTDTVQTGPSTGQGGSGYYAYIETSDPRVSSRLKSLQ